MELKDWEFDTQAFLASMNIPCEFCKEVLCDGFCYEADHDTSPDEN